MLRVKLFPRVGIEPIAVAFAVKRLQPYATKAFYYIKLITTN